MTEEELELANERQVINKVPKNKKVTIGQLHMNKYTHRQAQNNNREENKNNK